MFTSCSIDKRVYSSGYYISWHKSKTKNEQQNIVNNKKSNQKEQENNFSAENQSEEISSVTSQSDNITASANENLIIEKNITPTITNQESKLESYNNSISFSAFKKEFKKGTSSIIRSNKTYGASMNGLAVAGFICSIVGIIVFGLILGVVAIILSGIGLSKINKDPINWNGKGLAIAGIIIGILDIIGWAIYIALFLV